MDQRYKEKHAKGKRWKARRKKTRIWSRREGDSVVYMHRNRRNGKIYIGYTTRACFERWTYSEYEKNGVNSYIYRALMKEKELYERAGIQSTDRLVGFESRILVDGLSAEQAPKVEEVTVAFFRRKGCELYNSTDGGDAPPVMYGDDNPTKRPEVREAKSEAMKEYYENHPEAREAKRERAIKLWSDPELREAQRERAKKQWSDPELREAQSERLKNNPELLPNPPKPVIAINVKTGLPSLYFKSATSAEKLGFDPGTIIKCCKHKRKTHKNYEWRYADEKSNQ